MGAPTLQIDVEFITHNLTDPLSSTSGAKQIIELIGKGYRIESAVPIANAAIYYILRRETPISLLEGAK